MKIKLELFGASRDFSNKDYLELEVQEKASVNDLKNEIVLILLLLIILMVPHQ